MKAFDFFTFSSQDVYPVNIECMWRIETPPGTKVELNITDFDFEHSGSSSRRCYFDGLVSEKPVSL